MEQYVDNLEKTGDEGDIDSSELSDRLVKIAREKSGSSTEKKAEVAKAMETPDDDFKINYKDVNDVISKGVRKWARRLTN